MPDQYRGNGSRGLHQKRNRLYRPLVRHISLSEGAGICGVGMTRTRDADDPQALALDMEPEPEYFKITREEIDWLCCTSIDTGGYEPGTPEYELACKVRMKTKADIFSRPLAKAPVSDDTTISSLISENARIGAELRQMTERVKVLSGEHDARIAREENKRVLDELSEVVSTLHWITGRIDCTIRDNKCMGFEIGCTLPKIQESILKIKSLRSNPQEREGE